MAGYLLANDGAIVYVDGTEVYRTPNLPAGPVNISTLATASTTAVDDYITFEFRERTNILRIALC